MATNYPTSLDVYVTRVDNVDDVIAADPNDRGDAIEALQAKTGIDNSEVVTSIDYFLRHASGAYRTHFHDGSSDDGANIPDASLNQITTAAKVSGAALTLLTNIPAGAGEIPVANIPNLNADKITAGTLAVANGGTAAANAADARTNLGLGNIAVEATPLAVNKGGTGQTTAQAAIDALVPSQSGNAGKSLQTDGANVSFQDRLKVKVGSFTRDSSLASGNQAITGVGFQPKAVIFLMCQDGTLGEMSIGFADSSSDGGIYDNSTQSLDTYTAIGNCIYDRHAVSDLYVGNLDSLDSDGFTIAWTKTGSPGGVLNIRYIAIG